MSEDSDESGPASQPASSSVLPMTPTQSHGESTYIPARKSVQNRRLKRKRRQSLNEAASASTGVGDGCHDETGEPPLKRLKKLRKKKACCDNAQTPRCCRRLRYWRGLSVFSGASLDAATVAGS